MKKIIVSTLALAALLSATGCLVVGNRTQQSGGTVGQQLVDLQKAKDSGAITEAEFQVQKAQLLDHK